MALRHLLIPAMLALTFPALAAERTVVLDIDNMYCATCPYIVRQALLGVYGVKNVSVSLDDSTATVVFDDDTTGPDLLTAATTDAGYPARARP